MMIFTAEYDSKVYEKEAVLKAAYAFTDEYYVHIETNEQGNYAIRFEAKAADSSTADASETRADIGKRFENEILAQMVRLHVQQETKEVRVMLAAKALASSMLGEELNSKMTMCDGGKVSFDVEDLIREWCRDAESF